jgi:uncharacterized protein
MDTQENKRVVMEGYQMFQSGDIPQVLARCHDDAAWIEPDVEHVSFSGAYQGKAGIARYFQILNEDAQVVRFAPREFIAEGDKVIVLGEGAWRSRLTGRTHEGPWVHVFTMRDGKIARFENYFDTAAAERAFRPDQPGPAETGAPLHH